MQQTSMFLEDLKRNHLVKQAYGEKGHSTLQDHQNQSLGAGDALSALAHKGNKMTDGEVIKDRGVSRLAEEMRQKGHNRTAKLLDHAGNIARGVDNVLTAPFNPINATYHDFRPQGGDRSAATTHAINTNQEGAARGLIKAYEHQQKAEKGGLLAPYHRMMAGVHHTDAGSQLGRAAHVYQDAVPHGERVAETLAKNTPGLAKTPASVIGKSDVGKAILSGLAHLKNPNIDDHALISPRELHMQEEFAKKTKALLQDAAHSRGLSSEAANLALHMPQPTAMQETLGGVLTRGREAGRRLTRGFGRLLGRH